MKRVAVIGANGQLGRDLVKVLNRGTYVVTPLGRDLIDVRDRQNVTRFLRQICPAIVFNCAADVRVDAAEVYEEEAFRVNALGALNVARTCEELQALCVYISTDYVFDGEKGEPYVETDIPRPINVYGVTKLAGELFVRQSCSKWLIVRMSSLFGKAGSRGKGGNFVETILAHARADKPIRIVSDIIMSPTYAHDACEGLRSLIEGGCTGVVHLANSGWCSWHDFSRRILELVKCAREVEGISCSEYPMKAKRPSNSALATQRDIARLPRWQDALHTYLVEKGHMRGAGLF